MVQEVSNTTSTTIILNTTQVHQLSASVAKKDAVEHEVAEHMFANLRGISMKDSHRLVQAKNIKESVEGKVAKMFQEEMGNLGKPHNEDMLSSIHDARIANQELNQACAHCTTTHEVCKYLKFAAAVMHTFGQGLNKAGISVQKYKLYMEEKKEELIREGIKWMNIEVGTLRDILTNVLIENFHEGEMRILLNEMMIAVEKLNTDGFRRPITYELASIASQINMMEPTNADIDGEEVMIAKDLEGKADSARLAMYQTIIEDSMAIKMLEAMSAVKTAEEKQIQYSPGGQADMMKQWLEEEEPSKTDGDHQKQINDADKASTGEEELPKETNEAFPDASYVTPERSTCMKDAGNVIPDTTILSDTKKEDQEKEGQ